jgi:putative FmdB family regulatory protein
MPTYEYACPACKAVYDLRQGFDAEITHKCEECGKGIAKRVLHAPPVVFKGSGWYATDSRSKTGSESGKSDSSGAESEPKKSGTAESASQTDGTKVSDGKPAAKVSDAKPAAKVSEAKPAAKSSEPSAAS